MRKLFCKRIMAGVLIFCMIWNLFVKLPPNSAQAETQQTISENIQIDTWRPETTKVTGVSYRGDTQNFTGNYAMIRANAGTGHEDATKLYVTRSSGGLGVSTYFSDPIKVEAGKTYRISYELKIEGVTDESKNMGALFAVRYLDKDGNHKILRQDSQGSDVMAQALNGYPKTNQDWKQYEHTITIPDNIESIQLAMGIGVITMNTNATMTYYYDKLQMVSIGSDENELMSATWTSETTDITGIKPRPDTNDYTGNYNMTTVDAGDGHDSSYKLYVKRANGGMGVVTYFSEPMEIIPNKDYTTSYDLKIEGVSDSSKINGAAYMVRYIKADGSYVMDDTKFATVLNGYPKTTDGAWRSYEHTFTTPSDAVKMQFGLCIGVATMNTNKDMAYYFDNIAVETQTQTNVDVPAVFWDAETTTSTGLRPRPDTNDFTENYGMTTIHAGEGHESAVKLYVRRANGGMGAATYFSKPIDVVANMEYTTTYDLKIEGITESAKTDGACYMVRFMKADGSYVMNGDNFAVDLSGHLKSTDGGWKTYGHTFIAPNEAVKMQFGILIGVNTMNTNKDMVYYYDNLVLSYTQPVEDPLSVWTSETTLGVGIKPRPDTNDFTGNYDMATVNAGEGHEEAYKLYVKRAAGAMGVVTYFSEPIDVIPNAFYTTTYDLKIDGVSNPDVTSGATYMVRYLKEDGSYIMNGDNFATHLNGYPKTTDGAWKSYEHTITIPEEAVKMQIGLCIGVSTMNTNKDMAYYFDHITLEKVIINLPEGDEYRCTMRGATIRNDDVERLHFIAAAPKKAADAEVAVQDMGILVLPAKYVTEGSQDYKSDASLTLGNQYVTQLAVDICEAGAEFYADLNVEDMDPSEVYRAVAYVVYESKGATRTLYSNNTYTNIYGIVTAENGMCDKSVYGIAREIAEVIDQKNQTSHDWKNLSGADIYKYVSENYHLLSDGN